MKPLHFLMIASTVAMLNASAIVFKRDNGPYLNCYIIGKKVEGDPFDSSRIYVMQSFYSKECVDLTKE